MCYFDFLYLRLCHISMKKFVGHLGRLRKCLNFLLSTFINMDTYKFWPVCVYGSILMSVAQYFSYLEL